MIPETEKCRQRLTPGSFKRCKEVKGFDMMNKVERKMPIVMWQHGKEHLKGSDIEDRETGMKQHWGRKEDNTCMNHIPMCENTGPPALTGGILDKCTRDTRKECARCNSTKLKRKQVTLLEKISRSHFIFAKNIKWIAPHWSSLFSAPKTCITWMHLNTNAKGVTRGA